MRRLVAGPPLSARGRRILLALVVAGLLVRTVLAFAFYGQPFDQGSFALVRAALGVDPLDVYAEARIGESPRWPYPPGFFAWVVAAGGLADATGAAFHGLVQLPSLLADAALAWLVQAFLGRRGATEPQRLAAAGLVLAGPVFVAISGYHGHFDALAILPAVVAVIVWSEDRPHSALVAGALLGAGGLLKTVPLLLVLALLPTARSRGEALSLMGVAAAVVLVPLAPFALADLDAVRTALGYQGVPGQGGLSLLVQPELAHAWLDRPVADLDAASRFLLDHARAVNAGWLLVVGAVLALRRVDAVRAAVVLWLAFYVLATAFFFQYLVWGLPFLLLAGRLWLAAAIQALALVPMALFYAGPWESGAVAVPFAVLMLALWLLCAVALVRGRWWRAAPVRA